jgi:hypothetical protein
LHHGNANNLLLLFLLPFSYFIILFFLLSSLTHSLARWLHVHYVQLYNFTLYSCNISSGSLSRSLTLDHYKSFCTATKGNYHLCAAVHELQNQYDFVNIHICVTNGCIMHSTTLHNIFLELYWNVECATWNGQRWKEIEYSLKKKKTHIHIMQLHVRVLISLNPLSSYT